MTGDKNCVEILPGGEPSTMENWRKRWALMVEKRKDNIFVDEAYSEYFKPIAKYHTCPSIRSIPISAALSEALALDDDIHPDSRLIQEIEHIICSIEYMTVSDASKWISKNFGEDAAKKFHDYI